MGITIKEKVINETIKRINKRLTFINEIFNASPGSRICEIRIEAQKLLETHTTLKERTSKEFTDKIEALAKDEKKQFSFLTKQRNPKIIDEQVNLEIELSDLNRELYYIKRNLK